MTRYKKYLVPIATLFLALSCQQTSVAGQEASRQQTMSNAEPTLPNCLSEPQFREKLALVHADASALGNDISDDMAIALVALLHGKSGKVGDDSYFAEQRKCIPQYEQFVRG